MTRDGTDSATIEHAFYAAFAARDIEAMRAVWLDSDQAVCIHPGGPLLRGTEAVMQSWIDILSGASAPEIKHREIQRLAAGDLMIHTVEEAIRPADSDEPPTRLIATNIYRLTPSGWRMLTHHASLPVVARKVEGTGTGGAANRRKDGPQIH